MRTTLTTFATAAIGFASLVSAQEWDNGVLVLTDSTFDEQIAKYDYLLVEFYAPWCGHCKKLAPEYEKAAATLAELDPPMYVAKVDATEQKELADRFGIQGFPTLHWFDHGNKSDYSGGRTADTIVQWIKKRTGPPSTEVDCATLRTRTEEDPLTLAYVGALSGDLYDAFIGAAKRDSISEKYSFLHTSDESCGEVVGTTAPGVGATRRFDDSPVGYTGAASADDIVAWAKATSVPKLITFSEDYIEPIFADHNPALILFTEESGAGYQGVFSQAASDLQGEILFVTSGVTEGIQSRLAEFIGVTKEDLPSLRLISPQDQMLKYVYEGDVQALTGDDIKSYIEQYKAGSLSPHLKSEPVPENNKDPLTILVGKNWDEIVNDDTKDVLVKYYAPWCGHCKALAPVWDELAVHVKDVEDLVIAKFDATANEVAGLEIRGYPTLKWYPKGGKASSDYGGGRELGDFKTWLSENSEAYKAAFPAAQEEL